MTNEMNVNDMQELDLEQLGEVSGGKSANQYIQATGDVWVRKGAGLNYDKDNWTLRAEYATAVGGEKEQSGAADALYVTAGIPFKPWFKLYLKVRYNGHTGWVSSKYSKII